jgi:predicted secreted protein
MQRRGFLAGVSACGAVLCGASAVPSAAVGAPDIAAAFQSSTEEQALGHLFPGFRAKASGRVRLTVPLVITATHAVMIEVAHDHDSPAAVAITLAQATAPLAAYMTSVAPVKRFAIKLRIDRSTTVTAHVLAGGTLISATRYVKVTRGGYGTNDH